MGFEVKEMHIKLPFESHLWWFKCFAIVFFEKQMLFTSSKVKSSNNKGKTIFDQIFQVSIPSY